MSRLLLLQELLECHLFQKGNQSLFHHCYRAKNKKEQCALGYNIVYKNQR